MQVAQKRKVPLVKVFGILCALTMVGIALDMVYALVTPTRGSCTVAQVFTKEAHGNGNLSSLVGGAVMDCAKKSIYGKQADLGFDKQTWDTLRKGQIFDGCAYIDPIVIQSKLRNCTRRT